jgi:gliding motility-associated lipoprotein GldH
MRTLVYIFIIAFIAGSCRLDMYEKMHSFPKHEWSSADSAVFEVNISDSSTPHQLYLVFRHDDAFHFKNLWLNIHVTAPDTTYAFRREFILADNNKWLGTGMNDIYEERIPFSPNATKFRNGKYRFVFRQVMREDPLEKVANIGLRVEKFSE